MTRSVPAALLALVALALPAQAAAAKPALTIKAPNAGDLTLAHVVIDTKGATGTPKLALANKSKLAKQVTVVGGVKKLKKNRFLASVVVARAIGGSSAGKPPAFNLTVAKGTKSWKLTSDFARNLLGSNLSPKFCKDAPATFPYIAKKPWAGKAVPRFSNDELARAAYGLDCPVGYDDYETKNLQAALRGEPQPSTAPGAGGGGEDGEEDGEGSGGPAVSPTLQVSGTVFAEADNVFRYEITANEPVWGFTLEAGAPLFCPREYEPEGSGFKAQCEALGNSQSVSAGGTTMPCRGGEFSYQLECFSQASHTKPPSRPTVPANTTIVGRYKIEAGSVTPGEVKVVVEGPSGKSQQVTLAGP